MRFIRMQLDFFRHPRFSCTRQSGSPVRPVEISISVYNPQLQTLSLLVCIVTPPEFAVESDASALSAPQLHCSQSNSMQIQRIQCYELNMNQMLWTQCYEPNANSIRIQYDMDFIAEC